MTKITSLALLACILTGFTSYAQQGLVGEYYNGTNFQQKKLTRTDARISFVWNHVAPASGIDPYEFSARWKGKIQAPETGTYQFRAHVDDGIRVRVGTQMVINAWDLHDSERFVGYVFMEAGKMYDLQVDYFNGMLEGEIQLYWQLPSEKNTNRDKVVDGKYLFQPGATAPPPPPQTVAAKPVAPPKKVKPKPKPKPVVQKPVTPEPPKPVILPADSLEKYLPKNTLFVQSKSIMMPQSEPELDRLAAFMVRNPNVLLSIDGHTDNHGDSAKNMVLSQERTQVISDYLVQKGVAATRITAKGHGDTKPLKTIATGNPQNRRVEYALHY